MIVAPDQWELIGRVALAAACGAMVGFEREFSEKPAGLRTHALVALGAAAFTVSGFAALGFAAPSQGSTTDVSRIAAQVVNGIGFLGAGIVIFHGDRLRGLTTAAEMWAVAAIGVLSGLGMYLLALGATALILCIVVGGRPIEHFIDRIRLRRQRGRVESGEATAEEREDVAESDSGLVDDSAA